MRDLRRSPFCWQATAALELIRGKWEGKQRTTALAIYQAMTEMANENRSDHFRSSRKAVASRAGTTDRTVDTYATGFEELGLLRRHRQVSEMGGNLPNEWELLDGEGGAKPNDGGGEANLHGGGEANDTVIQEDVGEGTNASGRDQESSPDEGALKLCTWLEATAEMEPRTKYPDSQLKAARWLLDNVPRDEIAEAVQWAHTRTFWPSKVLTAGELKKHWPKLRAEWRGASRGRRSGRKADSIDSKVETLRRGAES